MKLRTFMAMYPPPRCQMNAIEGKPETPGVVLTVDQQGCMTLMATGVMLVKDIAGKACSRVLRVLYDSGGSKSMCHSRVTPTGARMRTDKQQLFRTLEEAYASKGNI